MNLIYTVAYGKPYFFEMAQECVNSIRASGFEGDVIVLTDKEWKFDGARCCKINVNENQLWRCQIAQAVNPEDYDKILFMDADIVMVKNPDSLFESGIIRISCSHVPIKVSPPTHSLLTLKEKFMHSEMKSICSGTICFPGKIAREFLSKWERRWAETDISSLPDFWKGKATKQHWDEAALFTFCIRDEIEWDYLPLGSVVFPSLPMQEGNGFSENTVLVHFLETSSFGGNTLFPMRLFADPGKRAAILKGFAEILPKSSEKIIMERVNLFAAETLKAVNTMRRKIDSLQNAVSGFKFKQQEKTYYAIRE